MTDETLSSENDLLIVVNKDDEILGYKPKGECHDGDGILHRAFSIFLFDSRGRLLIQQRSDQKRLWPGFWSNSCCSHPRKGEEVDRAAERRLDEELGLTAPLEYLYNFIYHARFGDAGSERELCSVLVGKSDAAVAANPDEIASWRWIDLVELDRSMADRPEQYSPWFKLEWQQLRSEFRARIESL